MPKVKVEYPASLFLNHAKDDIDMDSMFAFSEDTAGFVALHLDCNDYDDHPIHLRQKDIDVRLEPYTSEYALFPGAPIQVEITGYDYPDRMQTIRDRLLAIQEAVVDLVEERGFTRDSKTVSVTYIPTRDGCYV